MNQHLENVKEFHETFKQPVESHPLQPSQNRLNLRISLIFEELFELAQAGGSETLQHFSKLCLEAKNKCDFDFPEDVDFDIVECLDALCDIDYVMNGTVLELGLGHIFDLAFNEVHRSNMSKVCKTKEEAEQTAFHRKERYGEKCDFQYDPVSKGYIVSRINDSKTIKSINYSPAELRQFVG